MSFRRKAIFDPASSATTPTRAGGTSAAVMGRATSDSMEGSSSDRTPANGRTSVRDRVEASLREALLSGQFVPGRSVTLRGLAQDLGVSPMPVREAVRSLAAGQALEIRASGRIQVPTMTEKRLNEILKARQMLEPELAVEAGRLMTDQDAVQLSRIDDRIDASLTNGDPQTYMRENFAFHFHIYRAARSDVILPLVQSLWLQYAPFMRTIYGRVGTAALDDHHKEAIAAVRAGNPEGLRAAIAADIRCGMDLIDATLAQKPQAAPD